MEYIAQFKNTEQVSQDDWERVTHSLKVNDNTTIGEVREWMNKKPSGRSENQFTVISFESLPEPPKQ